jgi:hypothetical protein
MSWRNRKSWEGERNPIAEMQKNAPEKFVIVRDPSEDNIRLVDFPKVPRVSFIPPEHRGKAVPEELFCTDRPLHLIIVPDECPAPDHPHRLIRDSAFPTIDLQNLVPLLRV